MYSFSSFQRYVKRTETYVCFAIKECVQARRYRGGGRSNPLFWLTDHAELAAHFGFC